MKALRELITGSAVKVSVSWSERRAAMAAAAAAMTRWRQRIVDEHHRWFQGELARPTATITTVMPSEVEQAVAEVKHREQAAKRKYFASVDDGITAERAQIVADLRAHAEALKSGLPKLIEFDAEYRTFAGDCGEWRPKPTREQIHAILHAIAEWQFLEDRRSTQPPPAPAWICPEDNPIKIPAQPAD
jgi:hypothetical protein